MDAAGFEPAGGVQVRDEKSFPTRGARNQFGMKNHASCIQSPGNTLLKQIQLQLASYLSWHVKILWGSVMVSRENFCIEVKKQWGPRSSVPHCSSAPQLSRCFAWQAWSIHSEMSQTHQSSILLAVPMMSNKQWLGLNATCFLDSFLYPLCIIVMNTSYTHWIPLTCLPQIECSQSLPCFLDDLSYPVKFLALCCQALAPHRDSASRSLGPPSDGATHSTSPWSCEAKILMGLGWVRLEWVQSCSITCKTCKKLKSV